MTNYSRIISSMMKFFWKSWSAVSSGALNWLSCTPSAILLARYFSNSPFFTTLRIGLPNTRDCLVYSYSAFSLQSSSSILLKRSFFFYPQSYSLRFRYNL